MKIVFSNHARLQMKERCLNEFQVLRAVEHPHYGVKQSPTRTKIVSIITRKKKRYAMIVVYDQVGNEKEIVTTFLSSKLKKYL